MLIKYSGKYVKIYFNMKITFFLSVIAVFIFCASYIKLDLILKGNKCTVLSGGVFIND